jgi:hypothetical protein
MSLSPESSESLAPGAGTQAPAGPGRTGTLAGRSRRDPPATQPKSIRFGTQAPRLGTSSRATVPVTMTEVAADRPAGAISESLIRALRARKRNGELEKY